MSVDRRPPPPVHPSRRPVVLQGLAKLLGLQGSREDLSPQAQMGLLLARTRPEAQTYAGTVPHAEKQRRRAKAARRVNRGRS